MGGPGPEPDGADASTQRRFCQPVKVANSPSEQQLRPGGYQRTGGYGDLHARRQRSQGGFQDTPPRESIAWAAGITPREMKTEAVARNCDEEYLPAIRADQRSNNLPQRADRRLSLR